MKHKQAIKEFLFFIVAGLLMAAIFLILFEVGFRAFFYLDYGSSNAKYLMTPLGFDNINMFVADDKVGYKLKPNYGIENIYDITNKKLRDAYFFNNHAFKFNISTNRIGYRGKEYGTKKDNNTVRIIMLGGSTTWDLFTDNGKTWPEVLENNLNNFSNYNTKQNNVSNKNNGQKNYEVINLGVGGYNSAQSRLNYFTYYHDYNADVILYSDFFNDMWNRANGEDYDIYKVLEEVKTEYKNLDKKHDPLFKSIKYFIFFKSRWLSDDLEIKAMDIPTYGGSIENFYCNYSVFDKYYSENETWIKNYLQELMIVYNDTISRQANFYYVLMPVMLAHENMTEETGFYMPKVNIRAFHRPYIFKSAKWKNWHCVYASHVYHMNKLMQDLIKKKGLNITIVNGNLAFNDIAYQDRADYFADEMHLTKYGGQVVGKSIEEQYLKSAK